MILLLIFVHKSLTAIIAQSCFPSETPVASSRLAYPTLPNMFVVLVLSAIINLVSAFHLADVRSYSALGPYPDSQSTISESYESYAQMERTWSRKWSPFGYEKGAANSNESHMNISMYFEVQFGIVKKSPSSLLTVCGIDLGKSRCKVDGVGPLFTQVSPWFDIFADMGRSPDVANIFSKHYNIEAETYMMEPHKILTAALLPEFDAWFRSTNETSYQLQYNIGLPLAAVPTLLRHSEGSEFQHRADKLCANKPDEYKALVSLAAMTAATVTRPADRCALSKAYIEPWLVRTHFGDLAGYVASQHGPQILSQLEGDVLAVSGVDPASRAFPNGLIYYYKFTDIAERSGLLVRKSQCSDHDEEFPTQNTSNTLEGFCNLAQQILNDPDAQQRLKNTSGFWGKCVKSTNAGMSKLWPVTPQLWLRGLLQGLDLWTDSDSLIGQEQTIFRSRGGWRMGKHGHVFLESRKRHAGNAKWSSGQQATAGLGLSVQDKAPAEAMKMIAERVIYLLY